MNKKVTAVFDDDVLHPAIVHPNLISQKVMKSDRTLLMRSLPFLT
ncbi:hypothetical protein [Brasilonema sp. UFV-L1]|nr:hypothetical protein [Brasilonema sp. UFV-L1]